MKLYLRNLSEEILQFLKDSSLVLKIKISFRFKKTIYKTIANL